MSSCSESEYSDSDEELREAFAAGKLKPGLNRIADAPKQYINNIKAMREKMKEFQLDLHWVERLDLVNKPAPLAPELAAQMDENERKRENQLKNNKKLPQVNPSLDPVINDFKREMLFYRQAQAGVVDGIARLKMLGIATKRPDDYFAEMIKSDEHMQKIRENLMKTQLQRQRSEKVKQLRHQRKEGKALQVQAKLQKQQEKKHILDQVKKKRKDASKNVDFLDKRSNGKQKGKGNLANSKKFHPKRKWRDQKFGFGGKKKGSKLNTRKSSANIH